MSKVEELQWTMGRIAFINENSVWIQRSPSDHTTIKEWVYDTRRCTRPGTAVFMALAGYGPNARNGHHYIQEAYRLGIRMFLVDRQDFAGLDQMEGASILCVTEVLQALQAVASEHRRQWGRPLWAITGSNGKTQVKEWVNDLIADRIILGKTPGSFNSQLGVPLSVLGLRDSHALAVMEAGISKSGEMGALAHILLPDIGLLVHFGAAHSEGFGSEEEKLTEKLQLFDTCQILVARLDVFIRYPKALLEQMERASRCQFIFWEFGDQENFQEGWLALRHRVSSQGMRTDNMMLWVLDTAQASHRNTVSLNSESKYRIAFDAPNTNRSVLENMAGTALLLWAGKAWSPDLGPRFVALRSLPMRLEIRELPGSSWLVNDSYSLDRDSLKLALDEWSARRGSNSGVIVLSEPVFSDSAQLTPRQQVLLDMKDLLLSYIWDTLILVGSSWDAINFQDSPCGNVYRYESTNDLLQRWPLHDLRRLTILVKGARKFAFERIEQRLLVLGYQTVLEIDLEAAKHNFRVFKSNISEGVRVMVMVKARAYGSGSIEIARAMEEAGADYLAVAYAGEGIELRNEGIRLPIMVMNSGNLSPEALVAANLEPDLYDLTEIQRWISFSQKEGAVHQSPIGIHLQLDTGMRRLGLSRADHTDALQMLQTAPPALVVRSIYTHLTSAEDSNQDEYSKQQCAELQVFADLFEKHMGYRPLIHALNTAGILRFPDQQRDMVRLGLGLYGLENTGRLHGQLKPLAKFKTVISQIHKLKKGDFIGYGNEGRMPEDGLVGVLPVGYADGLRRALGMGKITFQCRGKFFPTIGRISMDFCLVYLGNTPAEIGDEVWLFGEPGTIETWAKTCDTIPYEVLTSISNRVQRVYIRG
jgi:alanine racemase